MLSLLISFLTSAANLSIARNVKRCQELLDSWALQLAQTLLSVDFARTTIHITLNYPRVLKISIREMIANCNTNSVEGLDLMVKYIKEELIPKAKGLTNKAYIKERAMERPITQMLLNAVMHRKAEPVMTSISKVNGLNMSLSPEPQPLEDPLTRILEEVYEREKQPDVVYQKKLTIRQRLFLLLSREMKEKIDLYLIGSSLTHNGSKNSDTDLCLVIYDSADKLDERYESKEAMLSKLEEVKTILESNGMATNSDVIPAIVPILKFNESVSGIEVNINVDRVVSIRNTHLMHTYSLMDTRVPKLILTVKLWAKKNDINSAYNKSLTSYSVALMVIHFLQDVCNPPVVPNLLKNYPTLFVDDIRELRLSTKPSIPFKSRNVDSLGQLFTKFFEYYCLEFNYEKVISIKYGALLDKEILRYRPSTYGRMSQWKCHICIEEPFSGDNTSHAVHNCQMFKEIVQKFLNTYQQLKEGSFTF